MRRIRKARVAQVLLLLVATTILLLLPLWHSLSGFNSQPSSLLLKQPRQWQQSAEAGDAGLTNRCTNPGNRRNHFLAVLIFNRVFSSDLFKISPYECKQWIEYMLYAGVEHIYWYDAAHSDAEFLQAYLHPYTQAGLLTYFRFHSLFPDSLSEGFHFEQDNSYLHFLANFAQSAKWVIQIDVDEYPFSTVDRNSCFLHRLLREYEARAPNVTQILLQCMFFEGNPRGDLVNGWVIERYQRRKKETEGVEKGDRSRQKPIYRADLCKKYLKHNPHIVEMKEGETVVASEKRIRMNHYWGARVTDFKPDTVESTSMLVRDSSMQTIASRIKQETGLSEKQAAFGTSLLRVRANCAGGVAPWPGKTVGARKQCESGSSTQAALAYSHAQGCVRIRKGGLLRHKCNMLVAMVQEENVSSEG